MDNKKRKLMLYLHIPFCVKKCAYCDFLSWEASEKTREQYTEALVKEIRSYKNAAANYRVTSIFAGGGTPSILTAQQTEQIFSTLRECFVIDADAEITIEANPGTVTKEKAKAWKKAGINRISIGLQSTDDKELELLGRIHTYGQFLETYRLLRETGFDNLNIDLISAIPGQTLQSFRNTLHTTAKLNPEHISAYSLIVEEGTPFYERYGNREETERFPKLPDEETERLIYEETGRILSEYGYERYEISNYAKKGFRCRHNEGYWRRREYLGIGLGASSLIGKQRGKNCSGYDAYIEETRKLSGLCKEQKDGERFVLWEETETLHTNDEMEEFMFLGLRLTEGISARTFKEAFGKELDEVYGNVIEKLNKDGLLERKGDRVRLTKRGIDISNYVFEQFLF